MKEPYKQGVANQFGRESCAGPREGTGEALTAGNPGQPLNSEIITLSVPTLSCQGEGHTRRSVLREFLFDATESETLCMDGNSHRGNRETSVAPVGHKPAGRSEKASCRAFDMHAAEESDDPIVPGKRTNKTGTPAAEFVEGRGFTRGERVSVLLTPDTAPDNARYRQARRATGRDSLRPSRSPLPKGGAG